MFSQLGCKSFAPASIFKIPSHYPRYMQSGPSDGLIKAFTVYMGRSYFIVKLSQWPMRSIPGKYGVLEGHQVRLMSCRCSWWPVSILSWSRSCDGVFRSKTFHPSFSSLHKRWSGAMFDQRSLCANKGSPGHGGLLAELKQMSWQVPDWSWYPGVVFLAEENRWIQNVPH